MRANSHINHFDWPVQQQEVEIQLCLQLKL